MRRVEVVMGVPMSLDVRGTPDERPDAAMDAAFALLHDADRRFSRHRTESELSRIRRGEIDVATAGPEMREVLAIAERATAASDGAFRAVDADGLLDTDGVVKGWAVQRAADALVRSGLRSFCLNAGGDVVTRGEPEPGRTWRVAVRHPFDAQASLAVLSLRDGAVATSGTYERGAHVWDGRTRSRDLDLVAATVVAADLTVADVLATTVLVLGRDGPDWAVAHGASLVLTVDRAGEVRTAAAAPQP